MKRKRTTEDIIIDTIIYVCLIFLTITTLLPFMQVVTISLSPQEVLVDYGLHIFPTKITLAGYKKVFEDNIIWNGYLNTIIRTVLGTSITVLLLILGAYPLSKKYLPNRKLWTIIVVFTMYFSGGLVPRYILINNVLKLSNTIWALVLPPAVSGFNLIIVRDFFRSIPEELEEAAKIDGANDIYVLFKVYVPLSVPILATVSLWSAVFHWNAWFDNMLYIQTESKWVLQYILRKILLEGTIEDYEVLKDTQEFVNTDTMKMATLIVSVVPILCVYPFIQKYFISGIKLGAVKG